MSKNGFEVLVKDTQAELASYNHVANKYILT